MSTIQERQLHQLANHQKKRSLVSIRRSEIDAASIQGFVLALSEELIVLQYVYDFRLDGLMVLRTADVTQVSCSATDKFQRGLLKQEGLLSQVHPSSSFNLRSWRSAISQLSKAYPLMILESEAAEEPDFAIGRVLKTTPSAVQLRYFSGAAVWRDEAVTLKFNDITSCQVGTNYLDVYQRHFERCGQLDLSSRVTKR